MALSPRLRSAGFLVAMGLLAFAALMAKGRVEAAGPAPGARDIETYQSIVGRLRAGEPYYVAVGMELRRAGYATREIFNWRTPLHWKVVAALPDLASRGALIALALLMCTLTLARLKPHGEVAAWTAVTMQIGVLMMVVEPAATLMSENWSGLLIGLSACAALAGHQQTGVVVAVSALFVRELAAPYCVAAAMLAGARRRSAEAATWMTGAAAYAFYYGMHFLRVRSQHLESDMAHPSSWLELGGLPSLLAKVHWHGWLLVAPYAATVVAFTLVCAGTIDRCTPLLIRTTSAAFIVFFLVAGKSFDYYWGMMAWPVWALACGFGAAALARSAAKVLGLSSARSVSGP